MTRRESRDSSGKRSSLEEKAKKKEERDSAFSAREVKRAAAEERIRVGIPLQKNSES